MYKILVFFLLFFSCQSNVTGPEEMNQEGNNFQKIVAYTLELNMALRQNDLTNIDLIIDDIEKAFTFEQSVSISKYEELESLKSMILKVSMGENEASKSMQLARFNSFTFELALFCSNVEEDPYLFYLLDFQQDLDMVVKVGLDPMLALYEWGEYEMMLGCMNNSWIPLKLHHPSAAYFSYDNIQMNSHRVAKNLFEDKLAEFNLLAQSTDWQNDKLCESTADLSWAFENYLSALTVRKSDRENSLLL